MVIVKAFYEQSSYNFPYILYIIYDSSHPLVSFTFSGLSSQIHKPVALQLIRQNCKRRSEVHPLLVYAHHPGQGIGIAEDPYVKGRIERLGVRILLRDSSDFGGA